ncbi:MAG: hypothetical protein D4R77_11885 [Planctomycetaceae bacterium]|nr:MAG: hypothetical protein D4R77_11885 [Planctomycetaceae bacterium]
MEIFNLDVGNSLAPSIRSQLEAVKIGPFSIRFIDDYDQKRRLLSDKGQFVSNLKAAGGILEVEEYTLPGRQSPGWVCTATITHDGTPGVQSLLAETPINDAGLWDLCELLTLFTGRRVTSSVYKERHGTAYVHIGRGMEIFFLALHAASNAWAGRENLVKHEMEMAIPNHNQAVSDMIQTQASHYTTALDIVCAKYPAQSRTAKAAGKIDKQVKATLKAKVQDAVAACEGLSDEQKASFKRILGSRVDQGLSKGFIDKLQDILTDFGAVEAGAPEPVQERVRFIDSIRNAIIHNGRLPRPAEGETRQQLGQRVATIVYSVIPEINCQAFYRVLGLDDGARQWLKLDSTVLREFFTDGRLAASIENLSDISILDKVLRTVEDAE